MENPIIYLVQQLLGLNKIKFDKEELSFQIQSHPSFPSLHAVTGVLDHFNIDNLTLDVPTTLEVLEQLPNVFLAQITTNNGTDLILVEKKGDTVRGYFSVKEKTTYSIPQFLEKFTGIIVAIEKTDAVLASDSKGSNMLNTILVSCLLSCLVGLLVFAMPKLTDVFFILLSVLGVVISVSIVKENLGIQSSLGEAFCATTQVKTDCNKVITSKGSKLFGVIELSDSSIIYFSAITLASLYAILGGGISHLYIVSLLAVPVVIYSVYYQYVQAKAWCPLCLMIAGILILQAVLAVFNISEFINFTNNIPSIIGITAIFLSVALLWNFVSVNMNKLVKLKQTKIDFFKFKRNFDLFKTVLEKSPTITTEINNPSEIVFGNKNAPLSIVVVTSPFCGHCKPVHNHIDQILRVHDSAVSITVRFNVNAKNTDADLFKITTRLTEIYHTQGEAKCLEAMHNIYNGMDTATWLAVWGNCTNVVFYAEILDAQSTWCKTNSINFTPEILVNGRSFPKEYNREDLGLFIEDLAEDCTQNLPVPATI